MRKGLPELPDQKAARFASGYGRVLGMDQTYDKTLDDLREELRRADVGLAVVHAEYEAGAIAPALNEAVSQLVANDPVFEGFGTVPLDARSMKDRDIFDFLGYE